MKRLVVIVDECGLPLSYAAAAQILNVKVQTLRNKVCAWRGRGRSGNWPERPMTLDELRATAQATRTIKVIDDRLNPNSTEPFFMRVTDLVRLSAVTRGTLLRCLDEWRGVHASQASYSSPIPLRAFLKFASMSSWARRQLVRKKRDERLKMESINNNN